MENNPMQAVNADFICASQFERQCRSNWAKYIIEYAFVLTINKLNFGLGGKTEQQTRETTKRIRQMAESVPVCQSMSRQRNEK